LREGTTIRGRVGCHVHLATAKKKGWVIRLAIKRTGRGTEEK